MQNYEYTEGYLGTSQTQETYGIQLALSPANLKEFRQLTVIGIGKETANFMPIQYFLNLDTVNLKNWLK